MCFDVISVDKLTNLPVFTRGGNLEFFDLLDHQVYIALRTRSKYQLCSIGANGLLALIAHPIRHDNDNRITLSGAYARGSYTCVACCAFDNAHAWAQVSSSLCF